MSTVMWRKTTCSCCGYSQEDTLSYYKHSKAWKQGHDLNKCAESRKVFANLFGNNAQPSKVTVLSDNHVVIENMNI